MEPSGRPADDRWVTPLWLSHHYPDDYGRCIRIGRTHVCRRCAVLYPVAFAVMAITLAVGGPVAEATWPAVVLVLAPLPAVVEFVLEHLGRLRYRPLRQVVVTVPLGIAVGVGFARYLRRPGDLWFWGVVVVYGGVCTAAALSGRRRPTG